MEVKINLHITVDNAIITLLTAIVGGASSVKPAPGVTGGKLAAVKSDVKADQANGGTASVEELRETASVLLVKNKAGLKEILTKYNAKTVAALDESDFAAALVDMKKALK